MANFVRKTDVLTTSAGSVGFCIGATLVLLAGVLITKISGNELVGLLFGREASASLLQSSQQTIFESIDLIFGNDILGRAIVFMVWMFIGLFVFASLSGLQKLTGNARKVSEQMKAVHVDPNTYKQTLIREFIFRIAIAAAWAIYTLLFIQFLLPFFVAAVYVVLTGLGHPIDWLFALAALAALILALHIHVIWARLFAGRVRLFGL